MSLILHHATAQLRQLLRTPTYWVPALLFPPLLFLFIGLPRAAELGEPEKAMAGFAAFAILGIAFFHFSVTVAQERASAWDAVLRALPLGLPTRLAGLGLSALVFAFAAILLVFLTAAATLPVALTPDGWLTLTALLLIGGIPYVLMGLALGYAAGPRGAVAIANILYLVLAFLGGLFVPPESLAGPVAAISPLAPSRGYAELLYAAIDGRAAPAWAWLSLVAWSVAAAALAWLAFRRDQGERYR